MGPMMAGLDIALMVVTAAVLTRGIIRGALRESLDLLVLIISAFAAFRFSGAAASVIASWSGASSLPARFMAGGLIFIAGVILGSYAASLVARRFVYAPSVWSRVLGGLFSLVWLSVLATLMLLVAVALPLSESADSVLAGSRAVTSLTEPGSPTYDIVVAFDQERVLEAMVNLDRAIGAGRVVIDGEQRVAIAVSSDIEATSDAARAIFDLLNLARVDAGAEPLAWSDALAEVAEAHAFEMYTAGYFSHVSPDTGTVAERLQTARIPYVVVGENLALAPTVENVHEGLLASPGHRVNMLESRFRRVGIGAYRGPLGLMVVEVFSG